MTRLQGYEETATSENRPEKAIGVGALKAFRYYFLSHTWLLRIYEEADF